MFSKLFTLSSPYSVPLVLHEEPVCHFKVHYLCLLLAFLISATLNYCFSISMTSLCFQHPAFLLLFILISDHTACLLFCKCPGEKGGNCYFMLPSSPQSLHIQLFKRKIQFNTQNKLTLRVHLFLSSAQTLYHCICSGI